MKCKRAAQPAGVLGGVVLIVLMLSACTGPEGKGARQGPMLPEGVRLKLEGQTRITSSQSGDLAWTMTCRGLKYYDKGQIVAVDDPVAWIPTLNGGTVEVQGREGRYFQDDEDIELEREVEVVSRVLGRTKWRVYGSSAAYRRKEEAVHMADLNGFVYTESGDTLKVRSGQGTYFLEQNSMRMQSSVECELGQGIRFFTDSIDYNLDNETAETDSEVFIKGGTWELDGKGVVADMNRQSFYIPASVDLSLAGGFGGGIEK